MRQIVSEFLWCGAAFGLVAIMLLALLLDSCRVPSDGETGKRFTKNRVPLTLLVEKISKEPENIVGFTGDKVMVGDTSKRVLPKDAPVSEEHFREYQALMKEAHVLQIWRGAGGVPAAASNSKEKRNCIEYA